MPNKSKFKNNHDWENPTVFEKNQEAPHTTLIPFATEEQALENNRKSSPFHYTLNGLWQFKWSENPEVAPEDFYRKDYDTGNWDEIKVPSNWQMEGFGHPMFRNVPHTFKANPPNVPEDYNPVGSYKRTFELPEDWQGRQIFLHFDGVKSASYVWINGEEVGYNQGGMEPAEYDITPYLVSGENEIAVQVLRYSDGTYLECQDMWRLSGIFRDVYLMATPKVHIRDFYVKTDLGSDYENGTLKVEADIKNYSQQDISNYQLQLQLFNEDQNAVFKHSLSQELHSLKAGEETAVSISELVKNPEKWSAEFPHIYTLIFKLINDQDEVIEIISNHTGFRQVEIKNQAIYINGVPVKFNGVNSHMQHPETGRMVDLETMKTDLTLMKEFNVNCVRTCHYPPPPEYLELADELGIYIVDETGDEAHATEYLSDDPDWKEQYLDRMRKMIYRDRNHPAVVIWSAGNESGWGENICALIAEGKQIDPSRPGWLYGGNMDNDPEINPIKCEDIVGPRYQKPFRLKHKFAKVPEAIDPRPSFMDEYLSAAGNSLGGLDEYWDLIYRYPRLTGGAIWDWISPGLKKKVINTPDKSPNNIKCSLMGKARLANGRSGKAVSLSGHDDWVEVYRDPALDIEGNQLSLSAWVYPEPGNEEIHFITKGNHQYGLIQIDEKLEFYIYTQEDKRVTVTDTIPYDWEENWHHLAGIYDGEEMKLFLDGNLKGTIDCKENILASPFAVNMGRNTELHGQGHEGELGRFLIDTVRIFDKSIPITKLYQDEEELQSQSLLWLDFDETQTEGDFYSLGIGARSYGLVWPDRKIKPELWQLKKSGQPVAVEAVDLESGKVSIFNRHHFKNLQQLDCTWQLTADDCIVGEGSLDLELAPLQREVITIPFSKPEIESDKYYHLLLQFKLADDTVWADKGHEIAWEQFAMPWSADDVVKSPLSLSGLKSSKEDENVEAENIDNSNLSQISFAESTEEIIITGENFTYSFNKVTGLLKSMAYEDRQLWQQGPKFNVWRAPLANELDGWPVGYSGVEIGHTREGMGNDIANGWRSIGLDRLTHELDDFSITQKDEQEIEITVDMSVAANNYTTGFSVIYNYTISNNGLITLNLKTTPQGHMTHWLPKIGLQMKLPAAYQNMKWYGRGPFENYPDRKSGAKIGIYENKVDDEYEPYLIPQDYGNKTDVKWISLVNDEGQGLFVTGDKLLNISTHKYSNDNLTRANYTFQLQESDYITLNLDHQVCGVGGSAISVLNQYRVVPAVYEYTIHLLPKFN